MTIIAKHQTKGSYDVTWQVHGRNFHGALHTVTYGHSERMFQGAGSDLKASREFGECVRHAAECAGIFDEENR